MCEIESDGISALFVLGVDAVWDWKMSETVISFERTEMDGMLQ
jgi:hypothetical protein